MVHKTMVKWGVLANTSTRRLPADFTLPGIAAIVAAGTENEKIISDAKQLERFWLAVLLIERHQALWTSNYFVPPRRCCSENKPIDRNYEGLRWKKDYGRFQR